MELSGVLNVGCTAPRGEVGWGGREGQWGPDDSIIKVCTTRWHLRANLLALLVFFIVVESSFVCFYSLVVYLCGPGLSEVRNRRQDGVWMDRFAWNRIGFPDHHFPWPPLSLCFITFHDVSQFCIVFHCVSLRFTAFHCVSLHLLAIHSFSMRFIAFQYVWMHLSAFHCVPLRFIAFHCVSWRFMAFHCVSLGFMVFHYMSVCFSAVH